MKTIILGPPGTGKTTTLLNLVDEFLKDGIRPKQIGYFSFTKKAATEAADRAAEKFGLDKENDLPLFRTLHSYAFNQLGMTKEKMMKIFRYVNLSNYIVTFFSNRKNSYSTRYIVPLGKNPLPYFCDKYIKNNMRIIYTRWMNIHYKMR